MMEKGIEGIDYVITECAHCKGTGSCQCFKCLKEEAESRVRWLKNNTGKTASVVEAHGYLKENQITTVCSVCNGVGKVVFWRPQGVQSITGERSNQQGSKAKASKGRVRRY